MVSRNAPKTFKRTSTMARRKASITRSRTSRLARFNNSRSRYVKNRRIASRTSQYSETKLIKVKQVNEAGVLPIQTAALCYYWGGVMQSNPTGWDANLADLDGINTVPGLAGNERVGNYIYYKKTHLTFQLDMNAHSTRPAPPIEFRYICVKARRANTPSGTVDTPQFTLFLNEMGDAQGYYTSGVTGMDMINQPINKRDWVVHTDRKFILSSPDEQTQSGYSGKYPCRKTWQVNTPYYAKTRITPVTDALEDLDAHYLHLIFASSIGKDIAASNWEVTLRGTTSYTDN